MHNETRTSQAAELESRSVRGRLHIIDVECAPDLGVIVRVLNLLAVARAQVSSISSNVEAERMRLRINARGVSAINDETLQRRIEAMGGVSSARVVSAR